MKTVLLAGLGMALLVGCAKAPAPAPAEAATPQPAVAAHTPAHAPGSQRGEGHPYELADTQVWDVPDPVSGRRYIEVPKAMACTAVVNHEHHPLLRSVLHTADTGMRAQPMRGVHNVLPTPTHATP
ncbi:hypothetical protein Xmlh_17800 [Xanthomonas axonopodis pv. melhusii]|uniref:Lipoprotein n=1 Tax=Xanthomonas axonopodis pv. melhusii TaxID=487834 RepID=A0A1T1NV69_9XANT|nr:hypothetical protein Xmlh_17800 [Xanthomonas axonopodis pv. melhusii]